MSTTPPKFGEELLGESWIELSSTAAGFKSPDRITPIPFCSGEEYLRLLREAQKESNQSSKVQSLSSSRRDSPDDSPKSPPNSPNTDVFPEKELKQLYFDYCNKDGELQRDTNWILEWSSRPDQQPPKDWKFQHPTQRTPGFSVRLVRFGKNSLFSREILYSLFLTNVLSLLLGTGLGVWLSKRGFFCSTRITIQ